MLTIPNNDFDNYYIGNPYVNFDKPWQMYMKVVKHMHNTKHKHSKFKEQSPLKGGPHTMSQVKLTFQKVFLSIHPKNLIKSEKPLGILLGS